MVGGRGKETGGLNVAALNQCQSHATINFSFSQSPTWMCCVGLIAIFIEVFEHHAFWLIKKTAMF